MSTHRAWQSRAGQEHWTAVDAYLTIWLGRALPAAGRLITLVTADPTASPAA